MSHPILQANLGIENSLILMLLALVVFGPRRLPEIARQLGKLMYEFRKASNEFKYKLDSELHTIEDNERRKKEEERLAALPIPEAVREYSEAQKLAGSIDQLVLSQVAAEPVVTGPIEDLYEKLNREQAQAEIPVADGRAFPRLP